MSQCMKKLQLCSMPCIQQKQLLKNKLLDISQAVNFAHSTTGLIGWLANANDLTDFMNSAFLENHANCHHVVHFRVQIGNIKSREMVTGNHKTVVTTLNKLPLCFKQLPRHAHCASNNPSNVCLLLLERNLDTHSLVATLKMLLHTHDWNNQPLCRQMTPMPNGMNAHLARKLTKAQHSLFVTLCKDILILDNCGKNTSTRSFLTLA